MNTKVIITAEDQTAAGINSVKSSMAGLGATIGVFTSLTQNAISAIGELASQTIGLYKEQIKVADSMDEMSERMGMSIKDLVAWQAAAEMNGASLESMAAGTRMLAKHLTEHGTALRAAGITSKDANEAFLQLADLFKGMTDPVARLDLVTRLFGRGVGQQLLPVLVQGSEGLKAIRETTDGYGEALKRLSPEAQKLNDTLYLMGVNFKQAAAEGVYPLVKTLNEELMPALREVAKEGSLLKTIWIGYGGVTKFVFIDLLSQKLLQIKGEIQESAAAYEAWIAKFSFGSMKEFHLSEAARLSAESKETLARAAGKPPAGAAPGLALPGANTDIEAADLAASMLNGKGKGGKPGKAAAKTPLQKMIELGERNLAAAKAAEYVAADDDEEARLGAGKRAMESARLQEREAAAQKKRADAIRDQIEPLRVLARAIEEVNALRAAGLLTADQATAQERLLTDEFAKSREAMLDLGKAGKGAFSEITDAIDNMGNQAADAFAEMVVSGKGSFSDLINSMLKDMARLQAKAVFDPLTKAAGGWLKDALGGLFGGGGQPSVQGNADYIWDLHSGGIVGAGEGSGRHLRNLGLFAGAPKYHGGGLAGDEMPAVLKKGEGVFTPGQMKALGGTVNNVSVVVNAEGSQVQGNAPQAAELGRRIESAVRGVLLAEKRPGGLLGTA